MAEQQWTAKIRPELHPAAQELIDAYESVPGGKTYPCLPEGIAAVLDSLAFSYESGQEFTFGMIKMAALLRGEQP